MNISVENIVALAQHLQDSNLLALGPSYPLGLTEAQYNEVYNGIQPISAYQENITVLISKSKLPDIYEDAYIQPLRAHLATLLDNDDLSTLNALVGAVIQHTPNNSLAIPLQRFIIVIDDFYRTFLDTVKRKKLNFPQPLLERIVPLAVFQYEANSGPFTLPVDDVQNLIGGQVAVVSLPAAYRDHPLIWTALAHETGGHDVLHAENGLVEELIASIYEAFVGDDTAISNDASKITLNQELGLLWGYWLEEATSDVYGLLNVGPSFLLSFVPYNAALLASLTTNYPEPYKFVVPRVGTNSTRGPDGMAEVHPTDILRIPLAMGVISQLTQLDDDTKAYYQQLLEALMARLLGKVSTISISGSVSVTYNNRNLTRDFDHRKFTIAEMKAAAQKVGQHIATVQLKALGGVSIQQLVTWRQQDELTARKLATLFLNNSAIPPTKPGLLLAGAVLAALQSPDKYADINHLLAKSLDQVYAKNTLWNSKV